MLVFIYHKNCVNIFHRIGVYLECHATQQSMRKTENGLRLVDTQNLTSQNKGITTEPFIVLDRRIELKTLSV